MRETTTRILIDGDSQLCASPLQPMAIAQRRKERLSCHKWMKASRGDSRGEGGVLVKRQDAWICRMDVSGSGSGSGVRGVQCVLVARSDQTSRFIIFPGSVVREKGSHCMNRR